jgi:hypothetical protein
MGGSLVTLGIEKEKAKYEMCRVLLLDTKFTVLRLLYAALIVVDKRVISFIIAPAARATGRVNSGGADSAAGA